MTQDDFEATADRHHALDFAPAQAWLEKGTMYAQELSQAVRFETPVPYKQMKGARKWLGYRASKESEVDRIERLAVALTDMDFLKLVSRLVRDPRISTAALASSLSKGKYPYHAADIASEEIQAKLAAVDWPGGKPLVHPVSSPLTGERNNLISPCTTAEKVAMRTQLEASSGGGGDAFERDEEMRESSADESASVNGTEGEADGEGGAPPPGGRWWRC